MYDRTATRAALLAQARERLLRQRQALRQRLAAEMGDSGRRDRAALAGEAHDRGEESLVNALADVYYAGVEHDRVEAQDVEAALARIDSGRYGFCVDCALPVAEARLAAYPTAKRCRSCQEQHEKRRAAQRA